MKVEKDKAVSVAHTLRNKDIKQEKKHLNIKRKPAKKLIPVIVIPGYLAPKELLFFLKDYLNKEGFTVYDVDLGWSIDPVSLLAIKLKERVEEVKKETQSKKVNLVGISMGGIVGFYYIKKLEGYKNVKILVTVGTPFKGSWMAYFGILFMLNFSAPLYDLRPNSNLITEIQNSSFPNNVKIVSISSPHDFVVPPKDAYLKGAENIVVDVGFNPFAHQYFLVSHEIFEKVKESLLK